MADFVKKTWACDDTITADELNRLEGGVEEALQGGDKGYECKEEYVTLTDESVTTVVAEGGPAPSTSLAYSGFINANTLRVTFNGKEYLCKGNNGEYGAPYDVTQGSFDWAEYPFNISSIIGLNSIATETEGTYQVKVEALEESVETTDCFKLALSSLGVGNPLIVRFSDDPTSEGKIQADKSFEEISEASSKGFAIIGVYNEQTYIGELQTKNSSFSFAKPISSLQAKQGDSSTLVLSIDQIVYPPIFLGDIVKRSTTYELKGSVPSGSGGGQS